MSDKEVTNPLLRLWQHLTRRRRSEFFLLLLLMMLASIAEVVSVGAIFPFLAALTEPSRVFAHPKAQFLIKFFDIDSPQQILIPLTFLFGFAAIFAGGIRLALAWVSTQLSFATGADLSFSIYRRTLYQPYSVHVARNSSEVINGIVTKVNGVIYGTIGPSLVLISSALILVSVLAILFLMDPWVSVVAFGGFGAIYGVIIRSTRNIKAQNSKRIARDSTQVIKSLQEGLGGIRDVLIDGSQEAYCQIYQSADRPLRIAQGVNQFVSFAPRYGMEALGMILIAFLAFFLAKQSGGITQSLPMLGVLALGAQRMLPIMQQAYASWSSIQGGRISLIDTLDLLDQPLPESADKAEMVTLPFEKEILLNKVSFRYGSQSAWIFNHLTLRIAKGARIGFIGTTGSGKSTLLDIIMGLLHPIEGGLEIDAVPISPANIRSWQAHIAHVPQSIFLSDGTIEQNIAFGQLEEKIDRKRVIQAASQAQIDKYINGLPQEYDTHVGERGVRLSGGQRQRIGIARALYKKADVIVFDEATSALDGETEQAVMDAIEKLGEHITILIIAHRLSTLKKCEQIVELGADGIRRIGTYDEIVLSHPEHNV